VNEKDADAIIEILKEKYIEGVVRGDEKMKQEVERLIEVVKNTLPKQ
jgi:hypothetical protein